MVIVSMVGFSPAAFAFSSYGDGSTGKPYRIATCAQLQEIGDNPDASYVLVSNIDCTDETITPVGNFTGTFDGRNRTIRNATINGAGLFALSTDAIIKNLNLSSSTINTSGDGGSIVGWAITSTLSNLHSDATVAGGSSSWIGGLVGILDGGSLTGSSYGGSVTGGVDTGGLIGAMNAGNPVLSNSYFNGSLTANSIYAGGLVGQMITGSITNSYSAGDINVNDQDNIGGLIGSADDGTITNSFAANIMTGITGSTAAVIGYAHGPSNHTGIYYDEYLANDHDANSLPCVGIDETSDSCSAKNSANATPDYFQNNNTSTPLNDWDFTNTWVKTAAYPQLRNITAFDTPSGIPNGGDANGDGTADSYQAYVANIKDNNGTWSTVQIPSSGGCTLDDTNSALSSAVTIDTVLSTKTSLDGFSVYCPTAGMSVPVSIIYPAAYDLTGLMLRHYNPTTHAWSTIPDANFSHVTIGGTTATKVTYTLADGGPFDQDGIVNGLIIDPVALAAAVTSATAPAAPDTGLPPRSPIPAILALVAGSTLLLRARRTVPSRR